MQKPTKEIARARYCKNTDQRNAQKDQAITENAKAYGTRAKRVGNVGNPLTERSFGMSSDRINFQNRFELDLRVALKLYNKIMSSHTDPVCGMSVSAETAAGNFEKNGEVFFFCSKSCLKTFKEQVADEKPEKKPIQTGKEKIPESEMKPDLNKTHTDSIWSERDTARKTVF